jgi:uncharacterized membrane protein YtjA (UPF0391 family)
VFGFVQSPLSRARQFERHNAACEAVNVFQLTTGKEFFLVKISWHTCCVNIITMKKAMNVKNLAVAVGLSAAFVATAVLGFAFVIITLILALLGFAGFGGTVAGIAKIILLVLALLSLIFLASGRRREG